LVLAASARFKLICCRFDWLAHLTKTNLVAIPLLRTRKLRLVIAEERKETKFSIFKNVGNCWCLRPDATLIMVMSSVEVGSDPHNATGFVPCI
jgi:hypothetical protein